MASAATARCPAGHLSATQDYCDECGAALNGGSPPPPAAPRTCPHCGEPCDGRFCEACGHDTALPLPGAGTALLSTIPPSAPRQPVPDVPAPTPTPGAAPWTAVVRVDRAWFEEVLRRDGPDAAGLGFPAFSPDRRFELTGAQLLVGRRSRSRGIDPQIDLGGPPLDPGVSAQHALLIARPDGGWELVDLGSTNGTVIGDDPEPIPPHTPVPLAEGTVVRIGAWTTITFAPGDQSR